MQELRKYNCKPKSQCTQCFLYLYVKPNLPVWSLAGDEWSRRTSISYYIRKSFQLRLCFVISNSLHLASSLYCCWRGCVVQFSHDVDMMLMKLILEQSSFLFSFPIGPRFLSSLFFKKTVIYVGRFPQLPYWNCWDGIINKVIYGGGLWHIQDHVCVPGMPRGEAKTCSLHFWPVFVGNVVGFWNFKQPRLAWTS